MNPSIRTTSERGCLNIDGTLPSAWSAREFPVITKMTTCIGDVKENRLFLICPVSPSFSAYPAKHGTTMLVKPSNRRPDYSRVFFSFLLAHWILALLFNLLKIKRDINQQECTIVELHFVNNWHSFEVVNRVSYAQLSSRWKIEIHFMQIHLGLAEQ